MNADDVGQRAERMLIPRQIGVFGLWLCQRLASQAGRGGVSFTEGGFMYKEGGSGSSNRRLRANEEDGSRNVLSSWVKTRDSKS